MCWGAVTIKHLDFRVYLEVSSETWLSILKDFAEAKLIPGGICLLPHVCKEGQELLGEATPQILSAEFALGAALLRRGCQNPTSAE